MHQVRVGRFSGTKKYWENRYLSGGTSGKGSYGNLAEYKAEIINSIIAEKEIKSLIDFGCGDGNQLAYFCIPKYIGLDVSVTAIQRCIEKYVDDTTKSFFLYDSECFMDRSSIFRCDLALSLDVIYHLVEDVIFQKYMNHLFTSSKKYVAIYSSNIENRRISGHIKHRKITKYIEEYFQMNIKDR